MYHFIRLGEVELMDWQDRRIWAYGL